MTPQRLTAFALFAAAWRACDTVHRLNRCDDCGAQWPREQGADCAWCAAYRRAQAEHVLQPPARRGYGYATAADLAALGIDPDAERRADLAAWARDLELAVDAELITETEAKQTWASQTT